MKFTKTELQPKDTLPASLINAMQDAIVEIPSADILKNIDRHYWKRQEVEFSTVVTLTTTIYVYRNAASDESNTIYYSDSVSVVLDSDTNALKVVLDNPKTITYSCSNPAPIDLLERKYWHFDADAFVSGSNLNSETIYYSETPNKYFTPNNSGSYYITIQAAKVNASDTVIGDIEYVFAESEDAYPKGYIENYKYTYMGVPGDNILSSMKTQTGSYVGTGTYGIDNPNALTFEFKPKFVVVKLSGAMSVYGSGNSFFWIAGDNGAFSLNELNSEYGTMIGIEGNTLTWYSTKAAEYQANYSGYTYRYFAIG